MPKTLKKVTKATVTRAVKALLSADEKVTVQAVRDRLGGGSLRDLSPLVRQVKTELEQAEAAAQALPEAPDEVVDAAHQIWAVAVSIADEAAAAERRDKLAAAERHYAEMAEMDEQLGALEAELDAAFARAADLEQRLEQAMAQLDEQRLSIAALEGRLAERDSLAKTLEKGVNAQTVKG